jgi:O-antigen ligase
MQKLMPQFIYASLFILAIGLFTSISLMAGFHILMIPPILYYAPKYNWRKFPKSGWALLAFSAMAILSVIFNQDIISSGYKNISKTKYFIIGALSIIPLDFYFNQYLKGEEKTKVFSTLLRTFLLGATIATLAGLVGFFTGFNPILFKVVSSERNSGMFGMLMTYAHSIALFCTLLIAIIVNRKLLNKYIPNWALAVTFLITFYGLFATYTRGAMIACLASLIFIHKKVAIVLISIIVIISVYLSVFRFQYFSTNIVRQGSNNQRMGLLLGAIEAFKERPILGYGYQNYEPHSEEIKIKYNLADPHFKAHAHNNFIEILATTGILGFVMMVAWLVFWIIEVFQKKGLTRRLVFPFIVTFLVGSFTQVTFNDGEVQFFFLVIYALSVLPLGEESRFRKI